MPTHTPEALIVRADLRRRLRCAVGHLQAIARMIEIDTDCRVVLQQVAAVQGALGEVNRRLVKHFLDDCLATHLHAPDPALRECALEDVVTLYRRFAGRTRLPGGKGTP